MKFGGGNIMYVISSVGDPDPHVSGFISQRGMDPDPDPSLFSQRC